MSKQKRATLPVCVLSCALYEVRMQSGALSTAPGSLLGELLGCGRAARGARAGRATRQGCQLILASPILPRLPCGPVLRPGHLRERCPEGEALWGPGCSGERFHQPVH